MTVACIVQARVGSRRLPGKTMLYLPTRRTIIAEVLERCSSIDGVDKVVAALPDTPENDLLEQHIQDAWRSGMIYRNPVVVRGSESDVLARYAHAAETAGATQVLRVTSDCPCIQADVCTQVLKKLQEENIDYCSNVHPRTYPTGYDCEAFTVQALRRAHLSATDADEREHVTGWLVTSPSIRRGNVAQNVDESERRLCVDTIADYINICAELRRNPAL